MAPDRSTSGTSITRGKVGTASANAVAAAAPTTNCPSAPMLNTPARNAIATASPARISGVARTSVPDPNAYHEPNAPLNNARRAPPSISSSRHARTPDRREAANHRDTEHRSKCEHGEQPLPADRVHNRIHQQNRERREQKSE